MIKWLLDKIYGPDNTDELRARRDEMQARVDKLKVNIEGLKKELEEADETIAEQTRKCKDLLNELGESHLKEVKK